MAAEKVVCLICGSNKTDRQILKHRNDKLSPDFGFCKSCLRKNVDDDDLDSVIDMLRLMNIPFIQDVWENAIGKGGGSIFTKYLQLIATNKKFETFNESISEMGILEEIEPATRMSGFSASEEEFEVTNDILAKWGTGKSVAEYIEYENLLDSLKRIKEPSSAIEEKRYVTNVKLGKALDDALSEGEHKSITGLRKAYVEDLEKLGLDTVNLGEEKGRTLGVRIRDWEESKPIPEPNEFSDVDNITNYVNKWFTIPMKRVFGRASEAEISNLYED